MIQRKYLLKLQGRSTGNYEVFTSEELDKLIEWFSASLSFDIAVHGSKDSPENVVLRKLIDVLRYTKPSE